MIISLEETIARYMAFREIEVFGKNATKEMLLYWVQSHDEYLYRASEIIRMINDEEFRKEIESEVVTELDHEQ